MAINFPNTPTDGQIYSSGGSSWVFNSAANVWLSSTSTYGPGGLFYGNNGERGSPSGFGDIFRVHSNTLSGNVYISSGNNSLASGPITISTGYRLQINTGARVAIV